MLPSIIAAHRDHSQFVWLWLTNVIGDALFCVGWIAAVIWALMDPAKRAKEER